MKISSPAKINLCLDVLNGPLAHRPDGYHEIQTVLYEYKELADEIAILNTKDHDKVAMVDGKSGKPLKHFIKQEENLAYKALQLFKKELKSKEFAKILIKKNIPLASGLGGASSNAAAVLRGLNKLWKANVSQKKLIKIAAKIGMDVPFFILGGTVLASHYGEKVQPLKAIKNLKIKIFSKSSPLKNKTKNAYVRIKIENCGKNIHKTKALIKTINGLSNRSRQDAALFKKALIENCHNDFETLFPPKTFKRGRHLNGAGPSTFEIIS